MDGCNIENLVSGVVGAIAQVATAVVDALSPTAEEGGILGGIAGAIVGVAEAVLAATAAAANVGEDGELDIDDVEELFAEKFKLLVGAFIFSIGSNSKNYEEVPVSEGEGIWLPPVLYDYDKDSEKYSISSQNTLARLSQQWFDAKTLEEKHKIEKELIYFRSNIPSDDAISRKFEDRINEVFAGAVGQLALYPVESSEAQLAGRIEDLNQSEGNYIYNALTDDDTVMAGVTKRLEYVGRTPSKSSRTGRNVISQMTEEGKIKNVKGKVMFQAGDGEWYELKYGDMAHKEDAVKWWNENGRRFGEKAPEVRQWMLDPDNYYIEHYSINRSEGAKIGETYKPPIEPPILPIE